MLKNLNGQVKFCLYLFPDLTPLSKVPPGNCWVYIPWIFLCVQVYRYIGMCVLSDLLLVERSAYKMISAIFFFIIQVTDNTVPSTEEIKLKLRTPQDV